MSQDQEEQGLMTDVNADEVLPPEEEDPSITSITQDDIDMIERLVFAEAGTEGEDGRDAVRGVIFNRLSSDRFPNSVREVIEQSGQFEPIGTHGSIEKIPVPEDKLESQKYEMDAYLNVGEDASQGSTFFLNKGIARQRGTDFTGKGSLVIGKHTFYKGYPGQEPVRVSPTSHNITVVDSRPGTVEQLMSGEMAPVITEDAVAPASDEEALVADTGSQFASLAPTNDTPSTPSPRLSTATDSVMSDFTTRDRSDLGSQTRSMFNLDAPGTMENYDADTGRVNTGILQSIREALGFAEGGMAVSDNQDIEPPQGDGSVLLPYEPTLQEKAKYALSNFMQDKFGMENYSANKTAEKFTGNPNKSWDNGGVGLADFTPAGLIFGADNAKDSFVRAKNTDDKLGMGLAVGEGLLSVAEAFPLTKGLAKAGKRGLEKLSDVAANMDPNTVGSLGGNIFSDLPPAANAQKTQIAGTLPTYRKADVILNENAPEGGTLDFGAGLGLSQKELGYDTYEPFPRDGFDPTFQSSGDIPDNSYSRITNFNVLNVVPPEMRDEIVQDIGRVLSPDGVALITTRGRDVMSAKGIPGDEPMSLVTSIGTYQKGFTQTELQEYVTTTLGEGFEVTRLNLGPAGVQVRKIADTTPTANSGPAQAVLDIRAAQMDLAVKDRIQPSGENPLFDLSPESYTNTLPEQKPTYVPRQDAGTNKPLPGNDRGLPVSAAMDKIADRLAERMKPWLGTEAQYFYHTGPIVDKALDMGFSKEEIYDWMKEFSEAYAATSPRTETAQNIRNATLVMTKRQLGIDLDEMIGPGGTGINERGYPMMIGRKGDLTPDKNGDLKPLKADGIHRKLRDDVDAGGMNPDTNPKPATFAENVYGNLDGVTVDTHAVRGALDAMNEIDPGSIPIDFIKPKFRDKYLADPSSLDPATMIDDSIKSQTNKGQSKQVEYAVFSDIYRLAAEKLGVSPAEAQSMGWFGSGDSTGLASELKSVARLLDERIDVTAQAMGETKETVFRKLLNRDIPVLQIFATAGAGGAALGSMDEQMQQFSKGGLTLGESEKGIRTQEGKDMANKVFKLDFSKADINDDGKLSEYEKARGEAIQKATNEEDGIMMAAHGGMPCGCGGDCDGSCGDDGSMPGMIIGTDPVSGNEIPLGSEAENVRDDIPAMLSEGEYVLPADVVKWLGLKHISGMMMEAKAGLMSLQAMGQIHEVEEVFYDEEEEYSEDMVECPECDGEGCEHCDGLGYHSETEESYETSEGNEVDIAEVITEEETPEYDEEEDTVDTVSYAMKSTPKIAFIR